jgi:hypothetical protein
MTSKKTKHLIFLVIALVYVNLSQAQQSNNSSGGNSTGSGGSVSYSVGQILYTTHTDTSGSISFGVQQAFEIFTVGIKETTLNISLSVFPNPTSDNLILQISNYKNEKLSFQLSDIQGKLVNNGQVESQQTEIKTVNLASATYFIHVFNQQNHKLQTFKIIKK